MIYNVILQKLCSQVSTVFDQQVLFTEGQSETFTEGYNLLSMSSVPKQLVHLQPGGDSKIHIRLVYIKGLVRDLHAVSLNHQQLSWFSGGKWPC